MENLQWIDGQGNISCLVTPELEEMITQWMNERDWWEAPKTTANVFMEEFQELVDLTRHEVATMQCSRHAFPAEMNAEENLKLGTIDCVDGPEDSGHTAEELLALERSMLEEIPLPGTPVGEAARRHEKVCSPNRSQP